MKIVDVRALPCDGGYRPWLFVKVVTDEGLVGWGNVQAWHADVSRRCFDVECLSHKVLLGENPFNIEKLWQRMYSYGGRDVVAAISGIEAALWDIVGKSLGVPVYKLIGGSCQEGVKLYWSHCGILPSVRYGKMKVTYESLAEDAKKSVREGFKIIKTNIHHLTEGPETPRGLNGSLSATHIRDAVMVMKTIREAVGPDVCVALDVNGTDVPSSVKLASAIDRYDVFWLEDPTPYPIDVGSLVKLREKIKIPICVGETLSTIYEFKTLLESRAVDVIEPDLDFCGGVFQAKKIAAMAEAYRVPIAPHNCGSPLGTIISGHVCITLPNFLALEFEGNDVPWRDDVLSEPLKVKSGFLELSDKPGFGVEIDEEEIARHPLEK